MNSRRIDHARADRLVIAVVEQNKAMCDQTMQEIADDPRETSTVSFVFALATLVASVGTTVYGAEQFVELLRAALLELSLHEDDDEQQPG